LESKRLERGPITASQIEAARVAINRYLSRRGKVWIRIFPHKPITKKPAETRQGKGKGSVEFWAVQVKPGTILFRTRWCACYRGTGSDAPGR
jgi:large subunit ribosomal protein L16